MYRRSAGRCVAVWIAVHLLRTVDVELGEPTNHIEKGTSWKKCTYIPVVALLLLSFHTIKLSARVAECVTRLSVACSSSSLSGPLSTGLLLRSISYCRWLVCSCTDTCRLVCTKPVINFIASRQKGCELKRLDEAAKCIFTENCHCLYSTHAKSHFSWTGQRFLVGWFQYFLLRGSGVFCFWEVLVKSGEKSHGWEEVFQRKQWETTAPKE